MLLRRNGRRQPNGLWENGVDRLLLGSGKEDRLSRRRRMEVIHIGSPASTTFGGGFLRLDEPDRSHHGFFLDFFRCPRDLGRRLAWLLSIRMGGRERKRTACEEAKETETKETKDSYKDWTQNKWVARPLYYFRPNGILKPLTIWLKDGFGVRLIPKGMHVSVETSSSVSSFCTRTSRSF